MRDDYPHEYQPQEPITETGPMDAHPGRGCAYALIVMVLGIVCIVVMWRMVG